MPVGGVAGTVGAAVHTGAMTSREHPRVPGRPRWARGTASLGAAVLAWGLAACDGVAEVVEVGPDPGPAAVGLAEGLQAGDLSAVDLLGPGPEAQRDLDAVVADLGDVTPEVGVVDVDQGAGGAERDGAADGSAVATLGWSWELAPDATWSYTSTAPLVLDGETWRVDFSRSVVAPDLAEDETLDVTAVAACRGPVLGAGRTPLVTERRVTRVGIDRTRVPARRAAASARALARLADVTPGPYVARVRAAGSSAFVEAVVLRADDVTPALVDGVDAIRGARLIGDRLPLAPTAAFAAPLLGSVGPVTAEILDEDPERYQAGDVAGLSGLQARYDDRLRGTDGLVVTARAEDGTERRLFRVPPEAGRALRLSLDERLQEEAEAALDDLGEAGGGSALVAIRPSDGAIRAAASGPGAGGLNLATYAQVAPGSTFKVASSLALLRTGLTPDSPVSCPPAVVVDGKRFENYDGYPSAALGRVPLRTAVAQSCNTAFIGERGRLGADDLADAAASLGLGVDHDLGFPAYLGQVAPPASATEAAADLIGQGRVLASPMAMATVMASAQQGGTVVPHLVEGDAAPAVEAADVAPVTDAESAALRRMLRAVVTEGSGSVLADLPGPDVIAKTGTAEYEDEGRLLTHAWMVAAQGDLAVAVYVERGDSGSGTAGPVLERFLRAAAGRWVRENK